ncbi:low affinity immunoglobulin epsilon Fc receptor-like [Aphidius gifuensis]|nr:low affinity immunoglobulin epsilon Fc receptor-like [Aphidius gifuensis]
MKMTRFHFAGVLIFGVLILNVSSQFKNTNNVAETDGVQALLAKYLNRRLQNTGQLSTPPSASKLFSLNKGVSVKNQVLKKQNDLSLSRETDEIDKRSMKNENQGSQDEYDDYTDDLEGYEDSDMSPTRFDLLEDDCPNCVDENAGGLAAPSRWTMPLLKLGEKRYYLGIFFKANWYRASQYCRYHGMHLASISSQEENDKLEKHIKEFGLAHEHFWTSGTDQAEEGTFFWMANGRPVTFENWNVGEPNNFRYENGEEEHCLELWNRDGKGLKWNDSPCSFETYFVCEVS